VKKNMGSQDLGATHGIGSPGHDELAHDARGLKLFLMSHRLVVGHRNLAVVEH
jgi:hypothetical protein